MSKTSRHLLAAALPIALLAGCADFLKGPGLSTNPNLPTEATSNQLFVGAQVALMAQWENAPLTYILAWAQQIAGVGRQWGILANYNSNLDAPGGEGFWIQAYGPGGYRDLQAIVLAPEQTTNLKFRGEARVMEAFWMGAIADVYGDAPFSQALTAQPTFDTQAAIYAHVQSLLDSAIADLAGGGAGPTATDFFFNNNAAAWSAAAKTLKARFFMHTSRPGGSYSVPILDSVMKYTAPGVGISSAAGDWKPYHTTSPGSQNLWYGFQTSRSGDVDPSAVHINEAILAEEKPLLYTWYVPDGAGNFNGSAAGGFSPSGVAVYLIGTSAPSNSAPQWPILSYMENQMLRAEAQYRGATGGGGSAGALLTLNAYRVSAGGANYVATPTGTGILAAIIREKYVRNFFNIEVWQDYLRTCYPNLGMPAQYNTAHPYVPASYPPSLTEQQTNVWFVTHPARTNNAPNANNPKQLVSIDGTACTGQVNQP